MSVSEVSCECKLWRQRIQEMLICDMIHTHHGRGDVVQNLVQWDEQRSEEMPSRREPKQAAHNGLHVFEWQFGAIQ